MIVRVIHEQIRCTMSANLKALVSKWSANQGYNECRFKGLVGLDLAYSVIAYTGEGGIHRHLGFRPLSEGSLRHYARGDLIASFHIWVVVIIRVKGWIHVVFWGCLVLDLRCVSGVADGRGCWSCVFCYLHARQINIGGFAQVVHWIRRAGYLSVCVEECKSRLCGGIYAICGTHHLWMQYLG